MAVVKDHYYSSDEDTSSDEPNKPFKILKSKDDGMSNDKVFICVKGFFSLLCNPQGNSYISADSNTEVDAYPNDSQLQSDELPDVEIESSSQDSSQTNDGKVSNSMKPRKDFEEYVELESGG